MTLKDVCTDNRLLFYADSALHRQRKLLEQRGGFIEYFLELSSLAEAVCLHDRICYFPKSAKAEQPRGDLKSEYEKALNLASEYLSSYAGFGIHADELFKSIEFEEKDEQGVYHGIDYQDLELVKELKGENILRIMATPIKVSPELIIHHLHWLKSQGLDITKERGVYLPYAELITPLSAEIQIGIPYLPSVGNTQTYIDGFKTKDFLKAHWYLMEVYRNLSKGEEKAFEIRNKIGQTERLFIPPITALILEKINTPDQFIEAMLEVRQDLEPLRKRFFELFTLARSSSCDQKRFTKKLTALDKSVLELLKPYDRDSRLVLYGTQGSGLWSLKVDSGNLKGEVNWNGVKSFLISKGLSWIEKQISKTKIKGLFSLQSKFRNIPDYSKLIKKVWGYKITEMDIRKTHYLNKAVENLSCFNPSSIL